MLLKDKLVLEEKSL